MKQTTQLKQTPPAGQLSPLRPAAQSDRTAHAASAPAQVVQLRQPAPPELETADKWLLVLGLMLTVFLDFFQSATTGIVAPLIMGNLGASPTEYAGSTTVYAILSVLVIAKSSWLERQFGMRRYLVGSLLLFVLGSILASQASDPGQFIAARALQASGGGALFTMSRIAMQVFYTSDRIRFLNIYFYGPPVALALGPALGGYMLTADLTWRWLFLMLAPLGLVAALLLQISLPAREAHQQPGRFHYGAMILLALGIGLLQFFAQFVHFETMSSDPVLLLVAGAAVISLAAFVGYQFLHQRPLINMRALTRRSFLLGLFFYFTFYFSTYAFTYAFPALMSALGFNGQATGQALMLNGIVTMAGIIIVNQLLIRHVVRHKYGVLLAGFALGVVADTWLSVMSPDASLAVLAAPLVLQGIMTAVQLGPIPILTFGDLAGADFNDGYRVKNMIRQLTNSTATAIMVIFIQDRGALHQQDLLANIGALNPAFNADAQALAQLLVMQGTSPAQGHAAAVAVLVNETMRQAALLAATEAFRLIAWSAIVFAAVMLLLLGIQRLRDGRAQAENG